MFHAPRYTSVSGIWQSAWVEAVPRQHFERILVASKPGLRRSRNVVLTPSFGLPQEEVMPSGFSIEAELRASGEPAYHTMNPSLFIITWT